MSKEPITFYYFEPQTPDAMISSVIHKFHSSPLHRHDFFEFEYVLEGHIKSIINGQEAVLCADDFIFVTPTDIHSFEKVGESYAKTITINFQLDDFNPLFINQLKACVMHATKDLEEAFLQLHAEAQENTPLTGVILRNLLERILILLLRNSEDAITPPPCPDGIIKALGFIHKNFNSPMNTEDVCRICGYSTSYFCRLFKATTGVTFVEHLNSIRLESARRILLSTNFPILQICFDCGFSSIRNFNREFKKKYGISPSQLREENVKIRP